MAASMRVATPKPWACATDAVRQDAANASALDVRLLSSLVSLLEACSFRYVTPGSKFALDRANAAHRFVLPTFIIFRDLIEP